MIDVQNLCKDYVLKYKEPGLKGALKGLVTPRHRSIHAVSDLSFHIKAGEIVGFIGLNAREKHDDQDDVGDTHANRRKSVD